MHTLHTQADSPEQRIIDAALRSDEAKGLRVYTLDQLPHWEKLSTEGKLTDEELRERASALSEITGRNNDKHLSASRSPFLASCEENLPVIATPPDLYPSLSIDVKGRYAWNDNRKPSFYFPVDNRTFVYPYPDRFAERHEQILCRRKSAIFLNPPTDPPRRVWAKILNMPEHLVDRAPPAHATIRFLRSHEERHHDQLVTLTCRESDDFHQELDADFCALSTATKEGKEIIIHSRYVSIMIANQSYWLAPALDPTPPEARARSVEEIVAIGDEITTQVRRATIAFLEREINTHYDKDFPEVAYSILRKIANEGVFEDNKPAQHVAGKILQAIEYFSPGLSHVKLSREKTLQKIMQKAALNRAPL